MRKMRCAGDEAGRARERRQAHDREAQHDQSGKRRDVEQHDPAARIADADLRQEAEHEQADEGHVPQADRAPAVRPEGKEIRQPVFAAEGVGDGEEARRQDADLHEGGDAARLAIGGEVISDAGEARHRHDQRHVGEKD